MEHQFSRTELLIGKAGVETGPKQGSHLWTWRRGSLCEALARSGIGTWCSWTDSVSPAT